MIKILKLLAFCLFCIISIGVLYIVVVLGYASITEFNPENKNVLEISGRSTKKITDSTEITLISWNLGYAGLGKEMDFFYEGGKMVRPNEEMNKKYWGGINAFISEYRGTDFFLFQEVDLDSKRSYNINQYKDISNLLNKHSSVFANNYKSWHVPVPLVEPMGEVKSGIGTFSKFPPIEAIQISTPGIHNWPKRLFMLKRCFVFSKYKVSNGKELVIINLHNSAFSDEGELRKAELELLKVILIEEYKKGNYVIAGGDWNQNPPTMKNFKFEKYLGRKNWPIEKGFLPKNWNWAFDHSLPTNRNVNMPFDMNQSETTLIDYFVVSPNIDVLEIKTFDLEFENSDHLPVWMKVKLKQELIQ